MITEDTRQIILKELPKIIKTDEEVRRLILDLASNQFADKRETESHFDHILNELKRDREEQRKKWEEQNKKWYEQKEEDNKKWEEQRKKWYEQKEEDNKKWEEQKMKWEENQKAINNLLEEIRQMNRNFDVLQQETKRSITKLESSIGALGARWGLYSEESFRNGLRSILEETFQVKVIHLNEWDDNGVVFGRPDQVEIDIIIKNGHLIICELKSSISKTEMYIFERKVRFYEDKHGRKCNRMLVISPMVEPKAKQLAEQLGIEVYTHSYDVKETQQDPQTCK